MLEIHTIQINLSVISESQANHNAYNILLYYSLMATKTIRISEKVMDDLNAEKESYAETGTDKAEAVTITDTAWYDYIMKLGLKVFKSNRR